MYARIGQCFRQNPSATGHVERTSARGDTSESQERLRQEFTPAPHESLIRIRIGPVRWLLHLTYFPKRDRFSAVQCASHDANQH
jgi:hypothetical protein